MIRYLETFYRHRLLLLTPVVLALVASIGTVLLQPRVYESSAKLLFYGSSMDVAPAGSPYSYLTAADQQAGVLRELITTRSFATSVGQRGPLADYLLQQPASSGGLSGLIHKFLGQGGSSPSVDDLVYSELNQKVSVVAAPPQLVSVTFQARDPAVAAGTVKAIIDQFSDEVLQSRKVQAQAVVDFFTTQLTEQDGQVAAADGAVTRYLAAHPSARTAQDPALIALQHTADLARQRYQSLSLQLDQARLDLAAQNQSGGAGFRLIDPASTPTQPLSLRVTALRSLLGGLAGGLIVAALALLVLTAADTSLRRPDDVTKALGLRLAGSIPRLG